VWHGSPISFITQATVAGEGSPVLEEHGGIDLGSVIAPAAGNLASKSRSPVAARPIRRGW
jgi:hypothetical protein